MSDQIKFITYARKSTEDKNRQVRSIGDQKSELRELAARQSLDVIDILSESRTAMMPGRDVFNGMMERIECGEAQGILAWHPDRLARNDVDSGRIMHALATGRLLDLKFSIFPFENNAAGRLALSQAFA